jgi:DNA polymerase III delta subunit
MSKDSVKQDTVSKVLEVAKKSPPLVLIVCPDFVRRKRALDLYLENLKNVEIHRVGPDFLPDETANLSLFGKTPIYVVSQIESLTNEVQKKFVEGSKSALIIGVGEKIALKTPLRSLAEKLDSFIEIPALRGIEIYGWVSREFKRFGKNITKPAMELLIELCDRKVDYLASRIEQLDLYVEEDVVTEAHVRSLLSVSIREDDFSLLQSVIDDELIQKQARKLARSEVNPFGFAQLLFKNLSYAAAMKESASARSELKIPPWISQKLTKRVKSMSDVSFRKSLLALCKFDARLKNNSLDSKTLIAMLGDEL